MAFGEQWVLFRAAKHNPCNFLLYSDFYTVSGILYSLILIFPPDRRLFCESAILSMQKRKFHRETGIVDRSIKPGALPKSWTLINRKI